MGKNGFSSSTIRWNSWRKTISTIVKKYWHKFLWFKINKHKSKIVNQKS
jgi:hypothetical protein